MRKLVVVLAILTVIAVGVGLAMSHAAPFPAAVPAGLMAAGKVKPVVDRRFPLSRTADAIRYLEAGHARGKVIVSLEPGEPAEDTVEQASDGGTDNGLVTRRSTHSVDETVARLEAALQAKGIKLFALIDHSGEAARAGLSMPPTKLLVFGNPKAGTPIMLAAPTSAIDLPLKVLVWADPAGVVWIGYNRASYLAQRHHIPADLTGPLGAVEALVAKAAE